MAFKKIRNMKVYEQSGYHYKSTPTIMLKASMREMTDAFNEDGVVENICRYLHIDSMDFLPHGVTLNEFLERMDPSALEVYRNDGQQEILSLRAVFS